MMCEDDIGLTSAGEGRARVAQRLLKGSSLHAAFQIIAVSGEITLHYDAVYIQVSQPATGHDSGILIRRCKGRKDYTGERNHFASLSLLDDLPTLVSRVNAVLSSEVRP